MNLTIIQHCKMYISYAPESSAFGDNLVFVLNFGDKARMKAKLTNSLDWVENKDREIFKLVQCKMDDFDVTDNRMNFEHRVNNFSDMDYAIIPWSLMFEIIIHYDFKDRFNINEYKKFYVPDDSSRLIDYHANMIMNDYKNILKEKELL